ADDARYRRARCDRRRRLRRDAVALRGATRARARPRDQPARSGRDRPGRRIVERRLAVRERARAMGALGVLRSRRHAARKARARRCERRARCRVAVAAGRQRRRCMKLAEYAKYDALGIAALVAAKDVSPRELAETAAAAIEAINPAVNAIVETYPDRIDGLDERTLGDGPFRGVPFLMKDVFGHEAGRKIEFGSRLCRGMIAQQDSHYCELLRAAGVNILGRSAAPEYSMAGTTEGALYGNTATPWRAGYSAGGSA